VTSVDDVAAPSNDRPRLQRPPAAIEDILDQRTRELLARRRAAPKRHRRGWLVRRALASADVIGLLAAFALAEWLFGASSAGHPDRVGQATEILAFALTFPGWILLAKLYGLYDRDEERADHSTADDVTGVFNMVTAGTWVFVAASWVTGLAQPTPAKLLVFWGAAVALVSCARAAARALCRHHDAYLQNTLIIGAGHVGQLLARKLLQHPEYGVNLIGFVDEHPRPRPADIRDLPVLGRGEQLPELIQMLDVERVIVAFSRHPHDHTLETIRELNHLDVQVDIIPRFFEAIGLQASIHSAEGMPLLGLPPARLSRSSLLMKGALDLGASLVALVLLAPLLLVVAVAIVLDSRGPVFFRQVRMGANGRPFQIFKFRTMVMDADRRKHEVAHLNKHLREGGDPRMFKIPDDPRVTRVGRALRRFSLDELPQLLNVARGEMSLVGPRPLIPEEHQHVEGWARRRLSLKPGITGLWQVLGRDDIPFEEMVELDYLYVSGWSLLNDLKLIVRTLPVFLRRQDG
jgi:exopolysaccharide biosynthesis polyprenyl glycosylphosphotransferase